MQFLKYIVHFTEILQRFFQSEITRLPIIVSMLRKVQYSNDIIFERGLSTNNNFTMWCVCGWVIPSTNHGKGNIPFRWEKRIRCSEVGSASQYYFLLKYELPTKTKENLWADLGKLLNTIGEKKLTEWISVVCIERKYRLKMDFSQPDGSETLKIQLD